MRNLKPIKRVTIGEQVALQLAGMISDGRWVAGQKLPSESALCQALSIGRSTLREALKSLAFIGMVRMRPATEPMSPRSCLACQTASWPVEH